MDSLLSTLREEVEQGVVVGGADNEGEQVKQRRLKVTAKKRCVLLLLFLLR